eukprot:CAMPEP_0174380020 /NCGR_PEP_ID=MMETSP0811_2-20130205/123096_1 /TAXON_ID=73025 ORGANISM="Eutreptiella gymnastica-like, Strain CCMP1594" /NCGR_SAMPLE_ID=MMETSP0811_2 /ASSEMBLY_ACC=CAM_ASM_000667 /LENGTH=153 /DNA_ID=CAMNT_0015532745 /DNA_START=78 /DNA_END=540 /DNA_ORIENTATION=-
MIWTSEPWSATLSGVASKNAWREVEGVARYATVLLDQLMQSGQGTSRGANASATSTELSAKILSGGGGGQIGLNGFPDELWQQTTRDVAVWVQCLLAAGLVYGSYSQCWVKGRLACVGVQGYGVPHPSICLLRNAGGAAVFILLIFRRSPTGV